MVEGPHQNVSRETSALFDRLESLVLKWNPAINLVAKSTLADFRRRHVDDGVAVYNAADQDGLWVDMGSGGGFPGLIISALAGSSRDVVLIESDARKCAFLRTAKRELGLSCEIINDRIEQVDPLGARIISARALAPLSMLLAFGARHADENATMIFPKGANWRDDALDDPRQWVYDQEVIDNPAGPGSVILRLKNVKQVGA